MNYYERHLGDYAKDTAHLTMLEHGAYGLLLDRYYSTETGIPADQVHRLARARTREEKQAVDTVLSEFFTLTDGAWVNTRCEEEIIKAKLKISTARDNGKRGGRPKKETQEKPTGLLLGTPTGTQDESREKAHQTPDTNNKEPPITPQGGISHECKLPVNGSAIEFKTFMSRCKEAGQRPIADYQPVWTYAEKVGIPEDVVILCWQEFARRYGAQGTHETKKYRDWRASFRKCVEGNWFHLWTLDEHGKTVMTSHGRIAEKANS